MLLGAVTMALIKDLYYLTLTYYFTLTVTLSVHGNSNISDTIHFYTEHKIFVPINNERINIFMYIFSFYNVTIIPNDTIFKPLQNSLVLLP